MNDESEGWRRPAIDPKGEPGPSPVARGTNGIRLTLLRLDL
jgi:hypothetical protein